jgi:hypothetical protein
VLIEEVGAVVEEEAIIDLTFEVARLLLSAGVEAFVVGK